MVAKMLSSALCLVIGLLFAAAVFVAFADPSVWSLFSLGLAVAPLIALNEVLAVDGLSPLRICRTQRNRQLLLIIVSAYLVVAVVAFGVWEVCGWMWGSKHGPVHVATAIICITYGLSAACALVVDVLEFLETGCPITTKQLDSSKQPEGRSNNATG